MANAMIVGFLSRDRARIAFVTYFLVLVVFMLSPFTALTIMIPLGSNQVGLPFHWLHVAAPLVVLAQKYLPEKFGKEKWTAWLKTFSFILMGTMAQHSVGSTLFEYVFGVLGSISKEAFVQIWSVVFWIYPIERLSFAIVGVLIAIPLSRVLTPERLKHNGQQT
jgi:hypothetical protein